MPLDALFDGVGGHVQHADPSDDTPLAEHVVAIRRRCRVALGEIHQEEGAVGREAELDASGRVARREPGRRVMDRRELGGGRGRRSLDGDAYLSPAHELDGGLLLTRGVSEEEAV